MEALIHHFKLFTEGYRTAARRGLRRRRGAQGRVRRLSGRRRHQPALPLQDPRAELSPPAGDGLDEPRPHAGRRLRHPGLARHRVRGDRPLSVRRLAQDQPASFAFTPATLKARPGLDGQVPGRPPAVGGDRHPVAGAEAGGLGLRAGHPRGRRAARHAGDPGAGDRHLLHHVHAGAGGRRSPWSRSAAPRPARLRGVGRPAGASASASSARRTTAPPTASSTGRKSSAWAPAPTRRWPRSTTTTTRT